MRSNKLSRTGLQVTILLVLVFGVMSQPSAAQQVLGSLAYTETVSGIFEPATPAPHQWQFSINERELFELRLQRIGGQFIPDITITDPSGAALSPTESTIEDDFQVLRFLDGASGGLYTAEVTGTESTTVNPSEYTLTLYRLGERKLDTDVGLPPLTPLGTQPPPELASGSPRNDADLGIPIYGSRGTAQPDEINQRNRFVITGSNGRTVDLNNANPISRNISLFGFVDDGVGFVFAPQNPSEDNPNTVFFTNANIDAFEIVQGVATLTLSTGQVIETDFYRIASIEIIDGIAALRMTTGQRVILSGDLLNLKRRGGINGEGPNAEPVNVFTLQNEDFIETDLSGYDTLAYLPEGGTTQTRVLYGADARLISDQTRLSIFRRGNGFKPELDEEGTDTRLLDITLDIADRDPLVLDIDPTGMGDVRLGATDLQVQPLDGRDLSETLANVNRLLIEERGVYVERLDGSYRLSLPDRTNIETPAEFVPSQTALPNQEGYVPLAFNNLGADLFRFHPDIELTEGLIPVNRVIGNFYYPVEEFAIRSHTLPLTWERHYNSLAPVDATPAHLRTDRYLYASMGEQWRHAYQIDLDITLAPLGELRLVLPDGSQHIFRRFDDIPNQFRSGSLPSWIIDRVSGVTGEWQATTSEGIVYDFDRAGRLERIIDPVGLNMLFSPAPRDVLNELGYASGFYVTEPYGRRAEFYADANGRIVEVRDAEKRQIFYTYSADGRFLVGAQYIDPDQSAAYDYTNGQLSRVEDSFSPYHQIVALAYDGIGKVTRMIENPDGGAGLVRTTDFDYSEPEFTVETTVVNGEPRVSRWGHNPVYQLLSYQTPESNWEYRYEYTPSVPTVFSEFRQPNRNRIGVRFNDRGYLTELLDPGRVATYVFTYNDAERSFTDGYRMLLTQIAYPAIGSTIPTDTFTYNELGQLIESNRLIQQTPEVKNRIQRYAYDAWGRVTEIRQLATDGSEAEIITAFTYDDFGYLVQVSESSVNLPVESGGTDVPRVQRFQHDPVGRLLSYVDGQGNEVAIEWDNGRELIRRVEVSGTTIAIDYQYDLRENLTEVTDRGATTNYSYNSLNQIVALTDSLGQVTTFTYDEVGNRLSETLPDEDASTFTHQYDGLNRLIQTNSPNNLITRYSYVIPEDENITNYTITDPTGDRVVYVYNGVQRLTTVRKINRNNQPVFEYVMTYDNLGNLLAVAENHVPGGRELRMTYDLVGKPLTVSLPPSQNSTNRTTTTFTYDPFERLASVTNPSDQVIQYTRDIWGNIIQAVDPEDHITRYQYDDNDNLTQYTDPLERVTTYEYDELNRVIAQVDPGERRISYEYDERSNLIAVTDPLGNQIGAEYDGLNRLIEVRDPAGNPTVYEYDPLGRLVLTNVPGSRDVSYTYDREGNVVAVTLPRAGEVLYGYDGLGRVTSTTNALGHSILYAYTGADRIRQITDPLGNRQSYVWSSSGRMNRFLTTDEQDYEYTYDPLGRITRITERSPNVGSNAINAYFEYDPAGHLLTTIFATDRDRNNPELAARHEYEYTPNGRVLSYRPPASSAAWRMEYDAAGQLITATSPRDVVTAYEYDDVGNIITVIHAANQPEQTIERFEYDLNGNVIRYTSPTNFVSEFIYDEKDQLIQRIDGVGTSDPRVQTFAYDDNTGELIRWIDPSGNETSYRYDPLLGYLQAITRVLDVPDGDPQPIRYTYEYDQIGNLRTIGLPDGSAINMTYNTLNHRVRYVDAGANVWAYSYDPLGNLTQISDPLGSTTRYLYDGINRIIGIEYPRGGDVRIEYTQGVDERRYVSPQNGEDEVEDRERITYTVDQNGRIEQITHNPQEIITFERDNNGNITSRAQGNLTTTYTYDQLDRLAEIIMPNGEGTIRMAYDFDGRLTSITRNQEVYQYTYDEFGQVTEVTGPNNLSIRYTYDANGNVLTRDAGALGLTEYTYDSLYRPVRVVKDGQGIDVLYNPNGWVTSITRDTGFTTRYGYDANGRIVSIQNRAADGSPLDSFGYIYDAVGNINRITRTDEQGSTTTVIYSYDADHQIISERWLDNENQTIYSFNILYDDVGNRTELTTRRNFEQPIITRYEYNPRNQLEREIRNFVTPAEEQILRWFGWGAVALFAGWGISRRRRYRMRWGWFPLMIVVPLSFGMFQQQPEGDIFTYEYDNRGNLTTVTNPDATTLNYTYDSQNRVTQISGTNDNGAAVNLTLQYDVFSRLSFVSNPDESFRMVYDGDTLIGMVDPLTGESISYFAPFNREVLRLDGAGETTWLLTDALGTARRLIAPDGTILNDDANTVEPLNAFGLPLNLNAPQADAEEPIATDQALAGESTDAETADALGEALTAAPVPVSPVERFPTYQGNLYLPSANLYVMGVRAYRPDMGRFIQRDPVRQDALGTLYTYAYNRPGVFVDPNGLTPRPAVAATRSITLPDVIKPNNIPRPILPNIPAPQTVNKQQEQENQRPLHILHTLSYGLSEKQVGTLAPSHCQFHMLGLNPITEENRTLLAQPLNAILALYDRETGWMPVNQPNPTAVVNSFNAFYRALPLLETTQVSGRVWVNHDCTPTFALPTDPFINANQTQINRHQALIPNLYEYPLYLPLDNAFDGAQTEDAPLPIPPQPISDLATIQPQIDILNPGYFGTLHAQMTTFYEDTLLIQPPQPTHPEWRNGTRIITVAPPVHLQLR